jgi:hypothetical protein
VDQADWNAIQEMQLLPAAALGDHQPRFFEDPQVLHYPEPRHGQTPSQSIERLPILLE